MKNTSFERNNSENKNNRINYNEFFSFKGNDINHKKDIGKFLETLSNHFM